MVNLNPKHRIVIFQISVRGQAQSSQDVLVLNNSIIILCPVIRKLEPAEGLVVCTCVQDSFVLSWVRFALLETEIHFCL